MSKEQKFNTSLAASIGAQVKSREEQVKDKLIIDEQLRQFIPPLSEEERSQLEGSIVADGCRDRLIVARIVEEGQELFLLADGHNRYEICTRHKKPFALLIMDFADRQSVKQWMVVNQLSRRNATPEAQAYLRGTLYNQTKQKPNAGNLKQFQNTEVDKVATSEEVGNTGIRTADVLAQQFKTSARTIIRDADFAAGLDLVGKSNPALKEAILQRQAEVSKSQVEQLGKLAEEEDHFEFANASDITEVLASLEQRKQQQVTEKKKEKTEQRVEKKIKQNGEEKAAVEDNRKKQLVDLANSISHLVKQAAKEENLHFVLDAKEKLQKLESLIVSNNSTLKSSR